MNRSQKRSLEERLKSEFTDAEREIEELDQQIQTYGEESDITEPAMNHPGDAADGVYERERLMTIRQDLFQRKQEIGLALDKMGDGRYGECERCGQPIAIERLEALPFARHCIECQEIVEQTGAVRR